MGEKRNCAGEEKHMTRITIYNEFVHEQTDESVRAVYPDGIHEAIASFLKNDETAVRCFTLETVNEITDAVLDETDVMIWWGHLRHHLVPDEVAYRVKDAVNKGTLSSALDKMVDKSTSSQSSRTSCTCQSVRIPFSRHLWAKSERM